MIVFIDKHKKIIKYNFVTLISANILRVHFRFMDTGSLAKAAA